MTTSTPCQQSLFETHSPLTSSPADSLASHSARQESERARTMTVTSGRKLLALCKSSSPLGVCLKTLLVSSQWYSRQVRLTWKAAPLAECQRVTYSIRYSHDKRHCNSEYAVKTLKKQVTKSSRLLFQLVPQTRRTDGTEFGLLPTPTATDWKRTPIKRDYAMRPFTINAPDDLAKWAARNSGLGHVQLEPTLWEWMMGFPIGWTDLKQQATPSCRR